MKSIRSSLCFGSPISSTALNIKNDVYKNIIRHSHKKPRVSSSHKQITFLASKVKKKHVKHLSTHSIGRKQDSGGPPKDWRDLTKNLTNTNFRKNESALETSYNCLAPTYMFNNFSLPTFSHLENSFNLFNLKDKNPPDLNAGLNKNLNDMMISAQNNVTTYRDRLFNLINGQKEENENFKNDVLESSVRREQAIQDEFVDAEDAILGSTPSHVLWRNDSIQASVKDDFTPPTDNVIMTLVSADRPKKRVSEVTTSFLDAGKIQDEILGSYQSNFLDSDPYELPELNFSEVKDYEDELRKIPFEQGPSNPPSILNILNSNDRSAVIIQKDIYITNRILDQLKKKDDEKEKKIEAKENLLDLEPLCESDFLNDCNLNVPEEKCFMLKNNGQIVEDSFKMSNLRPSSTISRPNMIQSRHSHDSSKKTTDKLNVDMTTKTIITSTSKESGSEVSVVEVQKFTDKRFPFPFSTETVLQVFGSRDKLNDALSVVENSKAKLAVLSSTEPSKKGIESFQNMLTSLKSSKKDTIPLIIPVDPLNDKAPQPSSDALMRQAKHAELVKLAQTITANNKAMRITLTNKPKRIVIRKNQKKVKKNPPQLRKPFKESIEKVKIIGPQQIDLILGLSSRDSVATRKNAYFQPLKKAQNISKNQEVKKQIKKPEENPPVKNLSVKDSPVKNKPVIEIKPLNPNVVKKEIKVLKNDEDDGLSLRDRSILKDILDGRYKFQMTNDKTTQNPPKRRSSVGGSGKGSDEPPDDTQVQISKKMIEQMKKDSCENPLFPIRDKLKDCQLDIDKKTEGQKNKKIEAKVSFNSEKGNEPKVTVIEHYGPPKPKEDKPLKEPKITIIEHYPTEPVKTKTAPKEEIKPEKITIEHYPPEPVKTKTPSKEEIKPEKITIEHYPPEPVKTKTPSKEEIKPEKTKHAVTTKKDLGNVKVSVVIPQGQRKRQTLKSPEKDISGDKPLDKSSGYPRVFYVRKNVENKKTEDLNEVAFQSVAHQSIHQPIAVHPIPEALQPKMPDVPKQAIKQEVARPKPIQEISPKLAQPQPINNPEVPQTVQKPAEIRQLPKIVQPIKKPELAHPTPVQDPVSPKLVQPQSIKKPEVSQPKLVHKPVEFQQSAQLKPAQNPQPIKHPVLPPKLVQPQTTQKPVASPKLVQPQPIKNPELSQPKPVPKPVELQEKPTQDQFVAVQQPAVKPMVKKHPVLQDHFTVKQEPLNQVEVRRPSTAPNDLPKSQASQNITKRPPSAMSIAQSQTNIQGASDHLNTIKTRVMKKMNFKNNETVAETFTPPTQLSEFLFNFDKFGKETIPILDTGLCKECAVPEYKILDYPMLNLSKDGRHNPAKHGIISIEVNNNIMLKKQLKGTPSVTTVLNSTMADSSKAALSKWRTTMVQQLGEAGFRDFYKEQLKKGSDFHGSLHQYFKAYGLKAEESSNLTFKSVQDVLKNVSDVSVLESQVVHPQLGYRGVVDCVAKYKGVPVIIEWKRSDKPKPTVRHTFDAPLQLSAYIGALNYDKSYNVKIQGAVVVVAYSDGTPADVFSLSIDECSTYWKQWLARLKTYISSNRGFPLSPL